MIKRLFLFLFVLFFVLTVEVNASGFNLKSIGGVDTDGKLYSTWYHTDLQPAFSGEAQASSEVSIKIDEETYTSTADESGNWTWTPPEEFSAGEHSVVLTNQESDISFTLVLGEDNINWDEISQEDGETLPAVGVVEPTVVLLTTGGLFFALKKLLLA